MPDWEFRAVPKYSDLRDLPSPEARPRILEWLHSADLLQAAAGAHLVWDHLNGIFPDLLPEVASTYWRWHHEQADRDSRWLVRGSCLFILKAMKWPAAEIFYHGLQNAHLERPCPPDAEFVKYYSFCGQPPPIDPTGTVRYDALDALRVLGVPDLVSLARSAADDAAESVRVLAATVLAAADPEATLLNLHQQIPEITNERVEKFSQCAVAALRSGGDAVKDAFFQLLLSCGDECLRVLAYDLATAHLPQSVPLIEAVLETKTDLYDRANLILDLINCTDSQTRLKVASLISTSCDGEANFIVDKLVPWDDPEINERLLSLSQSRGARLHQYVIDVMQHLKDDRDNW